MRTGLLSDDRLYKDLKKVLREAGCTFERQGKGDHELWYSPITAIRFVVDNGIKSRHTANAVLKQAGLPISHLLVSETWH